jgi:alpha-glucosidase (family GH31 glycosyl hydrolase)
MVYQDQYLQFTLTSHEDVMATYGFGESSRAVQQLQQGSIYTLWATDVGAFTFDTTLYGSHPFVIQVLSSGKAHGFMFMNSNALELTVSTNGDGRQSLGIQSTGGSMEIYVFGGPTPEEVIRQYLEVIGRPALVPHWSLGFHNCRWGYENIGYVEEVVANYSAAEIPLQTQWLDIDYMDKYLDFTLDPASFSQGAMTAFVTGLHDRGQNFVPIVDPGIYMRNNSYDTYTRGVADDVFIMSMDGVSPYLGQVWPGPTYFPDWFAPKTSDWWSNEFSLFRDMVAYDGIWIDMNEVANFCNQDGMDQVG